MRVDLGDQLVIADLFRDVAENGRRNGEIEGADAILAFVQQLLQLVPAGVRLGIDGNVEEAVDENLRPAPRHIRPVFRCSLSASWANFRYSSWLSTLRDAPMMRVGSLSWPSSLPMIEGRKQLALGKVAGASENHIVKGFDRDDLAAHEKSRSRSGLRSL